MVLRYMGDRAMGEKQNYQPYRFQRREDDKEEINFRILLYYVLKKWRGMLLCGLVLGVLLSTWKRFQVMKSTEAGEGNTIAEKSYEDSRALLESSIDRITEQLAVSDDYLQNSILMNINPNDVHRAQMLYFVEAETRDDSGKQSGTMNKTESLLAAYTSVIRDGSFYQDIAKSLTSQPDAKYLRELVKIKADKEGQTLSISLVGDTAELVDALKTAVDKTIFANQSTIAVSVAPHKLHKLTDTTYMTSDTVTSMTTSTVTGSTTKIKSTFVPNISDSINVADAQENYANSMTSLKDNLKALNNDLDGLKAPDGPAGKRDIFKFGLIGLFAGVFVAAAYLAVVFVATDKLYDVDEVRNLYGVRILGTYFEPMKKRFGYGLDRLITKIYPHAAAEQNRENVLSVAAANIAATVNDGVLHVNTTTVDDDKAAGFDGALLLVGEPETLSPLRMKLPTTLAVNEAEDIVNDATGIQALQNASQVVLVGTLGKTTRKQLEAALLQLEAQKRALCGIVFA